ncbi:MAG: energy-coupling factor transporter transmembrane component T [Candidatus Njordarchaeales archaeon]
MLLGKLTYCEERNILNTAHISIRILWVFLSFLILFFSWNVLALIMLTIIFLVLFFSVLKKENYGAKRYLLKLFCLILLSSVVSQSIFYYGYYTDQKTTVLFIILRPSTPLIAYLTLGKGIAVTLEGFIYGIIVGLKILNTIILAQLFIINTRTSEIYSLLHKVRVPNKMILLLIYALRFLPITLEEFWRLLNTLKMKHEQLSFGKFILISQLVIYNLVRENIQRAKFLAISLETRSFRKKLYLSKTQYSLKSSTVLLIILILEIVCVGFISKTF